MSLILRKWVVFNPMYEIRSFVCNRKLTCATQYQEDIKVQWMLDNQQQIKHKME